MVITYFQITEISVAILSVPKIVLQAKTVHLLSFPFHCLKRSVSVTLGSSENHSSLERGGLIYGRSGSSVTINT